MFCKIQFVINLRAKYFHSVHGHDRIISIYHQTHNIAAMG